jgi:hypothetical protein
MLRPAALMIAVWSAAGMAHGAEQVSITSTYEAHLLIKVADLRTDQVVMGSAFRAGARMTSIGALGVLKPTTVLVQSNGAMAGADPRPGVYQQIEKNGQKHRVVRYSAPTPVDPLTGLLRAALQTAGASPCVGLMPVWDGHQRYDLTLSPLGVGLAKFNLVHPLACRLGFHPISGFGHGGTKPSPFLRGDPTASFAYEPRANVWVLTDIAVPTMLGAGHISLTSLHVDGARPSFSKSAAPTKKAAPKPLRKR